MKKKYLLLAATLSIAILSVSCSKTGSQGRVAQVFGKDIFITDFLPTNDELKAGKQSYPELSEEEVLTKVKSQKLSTLIWDPIMAEFAKNHDVEPTDEEIRSFADAMDAMNANLPPLPPDIAAKVPTLPKMDIEISRPFVKNWKISKALYEEYGGTVIFQQANPLEPVGAYRKLLESHEQKGNFKIYDEKLRESFWEYYVREHPFQVPPNEVDYSQPWWLKGPKE